MKKRIMIIKTKISAGIPNSKFWVFGKWSFKLVRLNSSPAKTNGKEMTNKELYSKALRKFRCNNSCVALCAPQPGQLRPVMLLKTHFGNS